MDLAPLLLPLLIVAGLGLVVLESSIRRPFLVAGLVMVVAVVNIAFPESQFSVNIGGTQVYLADIVYSLVTAAAIARLLRFPHTGTVHRILLLVGALAILSLWRGIPEFGLNSAVNDFRSYFRFLGAALYFSTLEFHPQALQRLGRTYVAAATAVALVVLARWASVFTGIDIGLLSAEYDAPIRVLSGGQTFFFAVAGLMLLPAWRPGFVAPFQRFLCVSFLLMTILLNRRTVWLALAVGLVLLAYRNQLLGRRLLGVVIACLMAITALNLLTPERTPYSDDMQTVAQAPTRTETLTWRVEGWLSLLRDGGPSTPSEWILGKPFGSGYEREVGTRTVESSPHSFYIQTLLRLGVVGLCLLIALYATTVRRLHVFARASRDGPVARAHSDLLLALLTMHLVWFITWQPGPEQGAIIGLAAGAEPSRSISRSRPPDATPLSHPLARSRGRSS